jgi:putative phage-type endonuclease
MKKIALEQGTPEWIAYRLNGVGGSDIASIVGAEGAFKKRGEVMMEKLGHQKALTEYQKAIFQDGHEWEALVRDQLNTSVNPPDDSFHGFNFQPMVVESTINDRFFASLDGIDFDREMLLEVKSCTSMAKYNSYVAATPAHYMMQVQWQMLCTGYHHTLLAFVCQGELAVKKVHADFDIQSKLVVEATEFLYQLDQIKAGQLPAPIMNVTSPDVEKLIALKAASAEIGKRLNEIEDQAKALAEKILADHNAVQVQSDQINIQWVEKAGQVDYSKIPELVKIDLNQYRKKGTRFIKITLK